MNSKNEAYLGNIKACAKIKTKPFQEIIDDIRYYQPEHLLVPKLSDDRKNNLIKVVEWVRDVKLDNDGLKNFRNLRITPKQIYNITGEQNKQVFIDILHYLGGGYSEWHLFNPVYIYHYHYPYVNTEQTERDLSIEIEIELSEDEVCKAMELGYFYISAPQIVKPSNLNKHSRVVHNSYSVNRRQCIRYDEVKFEWFKLVYFDPKQLYITFEVNID